MTIIMNTQNSDLKEIESKVSVRFNDKFEDTFSIPTNLPHPGPVLRGRGGTIVLDAESNSKDPDDAGESLHGQDLVIKLYWVEETRYNEADVILKARGQLNTDMLKHMPRLIGTRDISCSSTKRIYFECAVPLNSKNSSRILRILLFRKLVPLQALEDVNDIVKAVKDSFTCHYTLSQKGIEHGDVSVWNIMWDATNECGVLNEWNLALVVGDGQRNKERTGTLPFMARDLLRRLSKTRLYHHEVESFIWVFTWICLGGTKNATVKGWHKGSHEEVAQRKSEFLRTFSAEHPIVHIEDAWKICENLLILLHRIDFLMAVPQLHNGVRQPNDNFIGQRTTY